MFQEIENQEELQQTEIEYIETSGDSFPEFTFKVKKKSKPLLGDNEEIGFDVGHVSDRQNRDYNFFLKFRKYAPITHFVNAPEKYSSVYEKQYWNLTFFNRVCCRLRKFFSPLDSSPFSASGDCAFFECEIMYSPQNCAAYVSRSRELVLNSLKRFSKVMQATHADVYEDMLVDEIHSEETMINLGKFLKKGSAPRFVEDDEQAIPVVALDRNAWPESLKEEE